MSPAIDPGALEELSRDTGSAEGALSIVRMYLDHLADRRDAVLDAADETARGQAAHALFSPSALVGAAGLAARCREIESHARTAQPPSAEALAGFAGECAIVRGALERMLMVAVTD